jgi:hypothetical protein
VILVIFDLGQHRFKAWPLLCSPSVIKSESDIVKFEGRAELSVPPRNLHLN